MDIGPLYALQTSIVNIKVTMFVQLFYVMS